jgi:hypothetical protein
LTDNLGAADRYVSNRLEFFIGMCPSRKLRHSQFRLSQHRAQQVIEVVGNATGQNPQALQLLPRQRFFLSTL